MHQVNNLIAVLEGIIPVQQSVLATFAEFEGGLIRLRTREGMVIARAKGKLQGKQPKLSDKQQIRALQDARRCRVLNQ